MLAGCLALALVLAPHPNSWARIDLVVGERGTTGTLDVQALALMEVLPELGERDDEWLTAAELAGGRDAIERYVLGSGRLEVRANGAELEGALTGLVSTTPAPAPFEEQWIRLAVDWGGAPAPDAVLVRSRLFREENPFHRDEVSIDWRGREVAARLLVGMEDTWSYESPPLRRPRVARRFAGAGLQRGLEAPVVLALLLALGLAAPDARAALARTLLAGSCVLAGFLPVALGAFELPARLPSLAGALSVAYLATAALVFPDGRRGVGEAAAFGALVGLAQGAELARAAAGEGLRGAAALGWWAAEAAWVAAALALPLAWSAARGARGGPLPRPVVVLASIGLAAAGFLWFARRAGWLDP